MANFLTVVMAGLLITSLVFGVVGAGALFVSLLSLLLELSSRLVPGREVTIPLGRLVGLPAVFGVLALLTGATLASAGKLISMFALTRAKILPSSR